MAAVDPNLGENAPVPDTQLPGKLEEMRLIGESIHYESGKMIMIRYYKIAVRIDGDPVARSLGLEDC